MKVFKFGGASVRNAEGVRNLLKVLQSAGNEKTLVVVSAMGKTTNALEVVVNDYLRAGNRPMPSSMPSREAVFEEYFQSSPEGIPSLDRSGNSSAAKSGSASREKLSALPGPAQYRYSLQLVKAFHYSLLQELFEALEGSIFKKVDAYFEQLENFLEHNKSRKYDFVYDQIVGFGELISTCIISEYLKGAGMENQWLDARELIKTDSTYRDAEVQWEETQEHILGATATDKLMITQGFIGSDSNNFSTTLGREGSDYTAAIFAYCLNAEGVTIWKDVPGVLNADPRVFQQSQLLQQISYEEAIELAFYGATVIHPKTLQPLQRKEIPLFVRSFLSPEEQGTAVSRGQRILPEIPCFIVKKNEILISLSSLDFSFIVEENISEIFALFHKYQMKVDLIQNSAISFSVCVENKFNTLEKLINHLKARFRVEYTPGVSLYTIRHFDAGAIEHIEKDREVLLKQVMKETVQLVTAP